MAIPRHIHYFCHHSYQSYFSDDKPFFSSMLTVLYHLCLSSIPCSFPTRCPLTSDWTNPRGTSRAHEILISDYYINVSELICLCLPLTCSHDLIGCRLRGVGVQDLQVNSGTKRDHRAGEDWGGVEEHERKGE